MTATDSQLAWFVAITFYLKMPIIHLLFLTVCHNKCQEGSNEVDFPGYLALYKQRKIKTADKSNTSLLRCYLLRDIYKMSINDVHYFYIFQELYSCQCSETLTKGCVLH